MRVAFADLTPRALLASLSVMALIAGSAPARARPADLPESLELGRDGNTEPCTATRIYRDPAVQDDFAVRYSVTCRGALEGRFLGFARAMQVADAARLDAMLSCGEASDVELPGLGRARARHCYDKQLGLETIETRVIAKGKLYAISVQPSAQGPGEELLRILARTTQPNPDRGRSVTPVVQFNQLAPPPPGATLAAGAAADARVALDQGLRFIRTGLYTDSSRLLNNGLSRVTSDTPVETRIELLIAAGLADSNLRYFDSAKTDFEQAQKLIADNPGLPGAGALARKLRAYRSLDQLNQRQFSAVTMADLAAASEVTAGEPLLDPVTLRALNQSAASAAGTTQSVVDTPDVGALDQLLIDAQTSWAQSVALLAGDKPIEARKALESADRSLTALRSQRIDTGALVFIESRVERQRYKLLLREGRQEEAVAALDKAIAVLKQGETGAVGPSLAQAQLERASAAARAGVPRATVLAQFSNAVETLITSEASSIALPPAIEDYLDLLIADARANPTGESPARFFRALQAVGDPAIARQFAQLRSAVANSNPKIAARIKDRQDLEREINRLSNQISSGTDPVAAKPLEEQRTALENKLLAVSTELQADKAYDATNDQPASIADVQKVLRPGEAYFKLSGVRNYAFGVLIDANGAKIYRVSQPLNALNQLAGALRKSIDGEEGNGKLPQFRVGVAATLFQLITGPVSDRLLAAQALIVDGSGPLEQLPMGVLVTSKDSFTRWQASLKTSPGDRYSKVDFLAKRLSISNALSPRSLIVARQATPSAAPNPFIGFAEHAPVPTDVQLGDKVVSIGNGCNVDLEAVAAGLRAFNPIPARELDEATNALGIRGAPKVTKLAFTDTAIKERTDLNQFQVLHFATHGVNEGDFGCDRSPPGLVTSLGGEGSVALLSFSDIAKLKLDANLVVLSACETASRLSETAARAAGQESGGNASLEGLVRALLAANARAVMATYWPISNEGQSEQLITAFYTAARKGTIGEALRAAQTELIQNPNSSHPIFWGAFFLVGDAQKPLLTGTARAQMAQWQGVTGGLPAAPPHVAR